MRAETEDHHGPALVIFVDAAPLFYFLEDVPHMRFQSGGRRYELVCSTDNFVAGMRNATKAYSARIGLKAVPKRKKKRKR